MVDTSLLKSADELIAEENADIMPLSLSVGQGEDVSTDTDDMLILEPMPSYRPQPTAITDKALGEMQHRWSITPLYTKNYKYARNTEFMIDEYSGKGAVKLINGKILMADDSGRIKYHLQEFEEDLGYYGMRNSIIKNVLFEDDSYTHLAKPGVNMLDGSIYIDEQTYVSRMCISIDMDIFVEDDNTPKMQISHYDPYIEVCYRLDGGERHTYRCKLSELRLTSETMHTISIEIESITILVDADGILDDSYILIHSILVAVMEQ